MSKGRLFTIVGAAFGAAGVLMLGIAVALSVGTVAFLSGAERTDGVVIDLQSRTSGSRDTGGGARTNWYPTVSFVTADGRQVVFESSTGANPAAHEVGEQVPVVYDPDDPADARLDTFGATYLLPLIFGGIGIVFAPIGTVLLVKARRSRRLRGWLRDHGREVWAEVVHIGPDYNVRLNRRHPYVVTAGWQDPVTGRAHSATSDYLRDDPTPGLSGRTSVRVLYDPADPDRNLLDLQMPH